MSSAAAFGVSPLPAQTGANSRWSLHLRSGENLVISIALSLLMLLPLADIALRKFVPRSVSGAMIFVQQLTLLIGMLGACIAASVCATLKGKLASATKSGKSAGECEDCCPIAEFWR